MKTETKFCYKHKPTGTFVFLNIWDSEDEPIKFYIHLFDEFDEYMLFAAKNVLMETLEHYSYWSSDRENDGYEGRPNINEFEMVEVEITYKIKE